MPIVVQHQPVEAIGALAQQAGQAAALNQEQQRRDRFQLQEMEMEHENRKMQFLAQAEQQARAEEMNYQMQLNMQKRDIDMQLDLQMYAREKQKLQQTLNLIKQSDELSESEKEEFAIQATAAYAGVGTGISPASFNAAGNKALQNHILLGNYRAAEAEDIQRRLDSGEINLYQANKEAALRDLKVEFKDPRLQMDEQMEDFLERVTETRDTYDKSFYTDDKGRPYDKQTDQKIKPGTPKYEEWQTMRREKEEAFNVLKEARGQATDIQLYVDFNDELNAGDPDLNFLVENLGKERAFQEYLKRQPKASTYRPEKEPSLYGKVRRHPIMDTILSNVPFAGDVYFGATRGGEFLKRGFGEVIDPESDTNKYLRSKGFGQ
ncbi:MAG: hypothetical protein ACYSWO_23345 [Planctomycetota bacterium]|jgi:hypothetical protein